MSDASIDPQEQQRRILWEERAALSAATFVDDYAKTCRHTEAVSDCAHCNLRFLADYVRRAAPMLRDLLAAPAAPTWTCKAKPTADPPQDCDWPFCGCDPAADKVIEAIQESGRFVAAPAAPVWHELATKLDALEAKWDDRAEKWSEEARDASETGGYDERTCMQAMNDINRCINEIRELRSLLPAPPGAAQ